MPYITKTARQIIDHGGPIATAGELNYAITKELLRMYNAYTCEETRVFILDHIDSYLKQRGLSYTVINDIVGALECSRREFRRRRMFNPVLLTDIADVFYTDVAVPCEKQKIQDNGDVY
jgi:hypothetical protein